MTQSRSSTETPRLTSHRNSLVRQTRELKKRRFRNEQQLFRIEGYREIDQALNAGIDIEYAIYCDSMSRFSLCESTLNRIRTKKEIALYSASSGVFANLSQWQNPDGLLVVAKQRSEALEALDARASDVFLVVDGFEKPGNLGSIFRSADATGCNGVLISDPVVDLFNPNVIRASLGTVFTTPCAVADCTRVIQWLRNNHLRIVCSSPEGDRNYLDVSLGSGCAIVIGSERGGLGEPWFESCDDLIRLPNEGFADSINAAMAANVLLFESYRQRLKNV